MAEAMARGSYRFLANPPYDAMLTVTGCLAPSGSNRMTTACIPVVSAGLNLLRNNSQQSVGDQNSEMSGI